MFSNLLKVSSKTNKIMNCGETKKKKYQELMLLLHIYESACGRTVNLKSLRTPQHGKLTKLLRCTIEAIPDTPYVRERFVNM